MKICEGNPRGCLPPLSLYIHIPWCKQKCPYCDFNSYAEFSDFSEQLYVDALISDLQYDWSKVCGREIISIFIGGGTPTLFSSQAIAQLLEKIYASFAIKRDAEITIEANPGTVNLAKLRELRLAGINRISFGVQSFCDYKLKAIGRVHNKHDALTAVELAVKAGFANINLDLMYGLPTQNVDDALYDIEMALSLQPTHLSWYQLTIEPNTDFYHNTPLLPDEDKIFSMQTAGIQMLATCGYERYEISAYSKSSFQCQHNLNYWQFGDYLGIGAGAHGKITDPVTREVMRTSKYSDPKVYLTRNYFVAETKQVIGQELVLEFMMNVLRLCQPIDLLLFTKRTRLSMELLREPLAQAERQGFITRKVNYIETTELGRNFLNDLIGIFG